MNRRQTQRVRDFVNRTAIAVTGLAAALSSVGTAEASRTTCDRVAVDTINVDGMTDDWRGIRGRRVGKKNSDRSFAVRCAYDKSRLFVVVEVTDDRVIRGAAGDSRREDWVSLRVRAPGSKAKSLRVFPGTRGFKPKVLGKNKSLEVADSLQTYGFSVEVSIPLKRIPGWVRSLPALLATVRFGDADKSGKAGSTLSSNLRFSFSDADAVFRAFLRATRLDRSDLRLDTLRDVDLGDGAERVVAGGDVVGVLGGDFIYMRLPVASAADVIKVKVVNFSGTGRSQILAHFRQHGNGSREVVAVWSVNSDSRFDRLFAVEVRKEHEGKVIENHWALARAGSLRSKPARVRKRGYDLVVEAEEAVGFSASNYREARSVDEEPILLPWAANDARVFFFDGDAYAGSEPMDAKKRAKRKKAAAKKRAKRNKAAAKKRGKR